MTRPILQYPGSRHGGISRYRPGAAKSLAFPWVIVLLLWATAAGAVQDLPCLKGLTGQDAVLAADSRGRILYRVNETKGLVPASTLKILTALTSIHYLGPSYRFATEFYLDPEENLKMKGYGDPLLLSEVWEGIASNLSLRMDCFKDLVLDDTYFDPRIRIPGRGSSTNPYDAPAGALSANFNTIHFKRTDTGEIVSAEPQTPMTSFARSRLRSMNVSEGRHAFTPDSRDAARYAGHLLAHFLRKEGVKFSGKLRLGSVTSEDTLVYTHLSPFAVTDAVARMMEFSNNFMANQLFIAAGAHRYGPPGTLAKAVRAVTRYGEEELKLGDFRVVEGSGISRENRLSATAMVSVLERFRPYRHLLHREGRMFCKTGSLRGIRTRAGYIETESPGPYSFVILLNGKAGDVDSVLRCVIRAVLDNTLE